jgi:hypothetical protein
LIFGLTGGKTRRVCAGLFAVFFLTLTICIASLSPDKFFAELLSQNRVYGIIRALELIDGASRVEDSCPSALRSLVARALVGSGHCADISFISRAGSYTYGLESECDFTLSTTSRAGGTGTVARE